MQFLIGQFAELAEDLVHGPFLGAQRPGHEQNLIRVAAAAE